MLGVPRRDSRAAGLDGAGLGAGWGVGALVGAGVVVGFGVGDGVGVGTTGTSGPSVASENHAPAVDDAPSQVASPRTVRLTDSQFIALPVDAAISGTLKAAEAPGWRSSPAAPREARPAAGPPGRSTKRSR